MDIVELMTQFDLNIDFRIVIFLMAVGFCIKHIPVLSKVSNDIIPIVIICLSLLVGIATLHTYTADAIVDMAISYIITAAISIGLHQQGKCIFNKISISFIEKYLESKSDKK